MDTRFLEYCIKQGLFSVDALRKIQSSFNENTSMYEVIVHANVATQEQLAIAAGEYYKTPVVDLSQVTPEEAALKYGSPTMSRKLGFFPFAVDSVAGVLIAIIDYTKIPDVTNFMQDQRVERMNFYIAPCDTLMRYLDRYYDQPQQRNRLLSIPAASAQRRNSSIMKTQYISLDDVKPILNNIQQPTVDSNAQIISEQTKQIQKLQNKIDAISDENALLRQQIDKINRMLELEAQFSRQLASILKSSGAVTGQQFDVLLSSNR